MDLNNKSNKSDSNKVTSSQLSHLRFLFGPALKTKAWLIQIKGIRLNNLVIKAGTTVSKTL